METYALHLFLLLPCICIISQIFCFVNVLFYFFSKKVSVFSVTSSFFFCHLCSDASTCMPFFTFEMLKITKSSHSKKAAQTVDKKLFSPPRRGRIVLSANERTAEFLDFAIQAKFAYVNKRKKGCRHHPRMRIFFLSPVKLPPEVFFMSPKESCCESFVCNGTF